MSQTAERIPNFGRAHAVLGHCYLAQGRLDAAIEEFARSGNNSGNLGHAYALAGRTTEAQRILQALEQRYLTTPPWLYSEGTHTRVRELQRVSDSFVIHERLRTLMAAIPGCVSMPQDLTTSSIQSIPSPDLDEQAYTRIW